MACLATGSVNCPAARRAWSARSCHSRASLKAGIVRSLPPLVHQKGFLLNVQGGWAILRQSLVRALPVRGQKGIAAVEEQRTNIRMAGDWREISQGRSGLPAPDQSTEAVDKLGDNLRASPVKFPQQLLTPQFA